MTLKNNKKHLLYTMAGFVAVIMAYGISSNMVNASVQQSPVTELSIPINPGPAKYAEAGQPVLLSSTNTEQVALKRGQTATFLVTLTHESGKNPDARFIVTPKINSFLIPSSVLKTTTMQERATSLGAGSIPKGIIPIADLVEFTPQSVVLNSGESKQVEMKITLPSNLPDEMVGDTITISPSYEISGKNGIDRMGVFTFGADVKILE